MQHKTSMSSMKAIATMVRRPCLHAANVSYHLGTTWNILSSENDVVLKPSLAFECLIIKSYKSHRMKIEKVLQY